MIILPIKGSPAETQYHGSGKVWAAVKDNTVMAIRYMDDFKGQIPCSDSRWPVRALSYLHNDGLDERRRPTFHNKSRASFLDAAIKADLIDADLPRRTQYTRLESALKQDILSAEAAEKVAFGIYRQACHEALAGLGTVASGMANNDELRVNESSFKGGTL